MCPLLLLPWNEVSSTIYGATFIGQLQCNENGKIDEVTGVNDREWSTLSGAILFGVLRSSCNNRINEWNCGTDGGFPTLYCSISVVNSQ